MTLRFLAVFLALGCAGWTQDLAAQREAMRKLAFLEGSWSGEATVRQSRMRIVDRMTYKLDGLVLQMERMGRDEKGGVVFEALATIAYDDSKKQYRFRAHVQGKFIDAEFKTGEQCVPGGPIRKGRP